MKPIGARLRQATSTSSGPPAPPSAATSKHLFVYGTLLLGDVLTTLLDRIPRRQDATAPGWRVVRLPHKLYPGLVPGPGTAHGQLLTDLTDTEWTTLDAFEDPAYTLATIPILTPRETTTLTYLWHGPHLNQPWTTTDLTPDDLTTYLNRCRTWRQRHEQHHT